MTLFIVLCTIKLTKQEFINRANGIHSNKYNYNEIEYIVSHYPIHDSLIPKGMINIHGHTHRYDITDVHLNMCVEKTNYQPEQFLDLIKRKK